VHGGKNCHHYLVKGRWQLFESEPREVTYKLSTKALTDPSAGLYEYRGKIYYIPHVHGDRCAGIHKLDPKLERYVYGE